MTQYKILVVDDNADIRELLEILLTSEATPSRWLPAASRLCSCSARSWTSSYWIS